jgi:restriction system protein
MANQRGDNLSKLFPAHGGYRNLLSFKVAQVVYDATVAFCDRYIDKRSRTHDQMVQAARSGVQNIAEGSAASATSSKFELKLTGVAHASLQELLLDYEDFLRQRSLPLWESEDPRSMRIRQAKISSLTELRQLLAKPSEWILPHSSAQLNLEQLRQERAANAIICLIRQASFLLDKQLASLEKKFLNEGGFTERLYRERNKNR